MPELPEVETVVRRLTEVLPGKIINKVDVLKDKSFRGNPSQLQGQEIQDVSRRAKLIRFHLPDQQNILTHLKMTGQLIYLDQNIRVGGGHPSADWVNQLPSSHTRIIYQFSDSSRLYFNDQRIFGWMQLMSDQDINQEFQRYGPDVINPVVTAEYLQEQFSRRTISIKQAIMLNEVMTGVGNIYACDALNVAQISPFLPAKTLSLEALEKLLAALREVMEEALLMGGTTFDGKYVDIHGMSGGYQHHLKAYGRAGEQCYQCGGTIVKTKLGGRGTYYCENCQSAD